MVLGKFFKAPDDRKRYSIDYSDWLDAGELVSAVTFEVTPAEADMLVIDGFAINTDSKSVVFYASEGADGSTYKVLAEMTTTNGQVREDSIQFTARAP
ncbi:phage fiber-tail adaptor protein [Bradyrhizobium cenepequi]